MMCPPLAFLKGGWEGFRGDRPQQSHANSLLMAQIWLEATRQMLPLEKGKAMMRRLHASNRVPRDNVAIVIFYIMAKTYIIS